MLETLLKLQYSYQLDIVTPFEIDIDGKRYMFACLIEGFGAPNGMVIDEDWRKLELVSEALAAMGYGFSCLNIKAAEIDNFNELLDDWGSCERQINTMRKPNAKC